MSHEESHTEVSTETPITVTGPRPIGAVQLVEKLHEAFPSRHDLALSHDKLIGRAEVIHYVMRLLGVEEHKEYRHVHRRIP